MIIAYPMNAFRRTWLQRLCDKARQSSPIGKSLRIFRNIVKSQNKKYFAFTEAQIRCISLAIPSHSEGVGRRYQRGTGCGGRLSAGNERHESVRQRRVVLAPRCLASTVATVHGSPGRSRYKP